MPSSTWNTLSKNGNVLFRLLPATLLVDKLPLTFLQALSKLSQPLTTIISKMNMPCQENTTNTLALNNTEKAESSSLNDASDTKVLLERFFEANQKQKTQESFSLVTESESVASVPESDSTSTLTEPSTSTTDSEFDAPLVPNSITCSPDNEKKKFSVGGDNTTSSKQTASTAMDELSLSSQSADDSVQSRAVNCDDMWIKYRQKHLASNSDEGKALIQELMGLSKTTKDTNAVVKRNNVLATDNNKRIRAMENTLNKRLRNMDNNLKVVATSHQVARAKRDMDIIAAQKREIQQLKQKNAELSQQQQQQPKTLPAATYRRQGPFAEVKSVADVKNAQKHIDERSLTSVATAAKKNVKNVNKSGRVVNRSRK